MVYTDDVVFLQLKKCASTHFARIAFDLWGRKNVTYLEKHQRIPNNFDIDDRLVIGSVRNPYDWYVSWFSYGCQDDGAQIYQTPSGHHRILGHGWRSAPISAMKSLIVELSKNRKRWECLHADATNPDLFKEWLSEIFSADPYLLGTAYGRSPLNQIVGFMTFSYLYLFLDSPAILYNNTSLKALKSKMLFKKIVPDHIIRVEYFEEDLIEVFERERIGFSNKQIAKIRSYKRTNASNRTDISDYYDHKTLSLVHKSEYPLIEMYDYVPPAI